MSKKKATPKAKQPAPDKNPGGRPSKYTPEIVAEICERLCKGEPLAAICRSEGFPTPNTVRSWMKESEEVSSLIACAREDGEDFLAADCLNIADDNRNDTRILEDGREVTDADVVQRAKLRIDTRLKLLAKWNPKKYGDKVAVENSGNITHTIDFTT